MKTFKKHVLILLVAIAGLLMIPGICKAQTIEVKSGDDIAEKIGSAQDGDTVEVSGNFTISSPIQITDKNITITGSATISPAENFTLNGSDGSIITVGSNGNVTLEGVTLKGAKKYGVQAYEGGKVTLDGVTISDCEYAGILANGGTVTIVDLTLGNNGYAGIEIGKGDAVTGNSKVTMNGTVESNGEDPVFYVDTKQSPKVELENAEGTEYEVHIVGNSIVVSDENGDVLYVSEQDGEVSSEEKETYVIVTIRYSGETIQKVVEAGSTLADLDLTDIKNVEGKKFIGFVDLNGDDFAEDEEINADIILEAKYENVKVEEQNTETPKDDEDQPETPATVEETTEKDESPKTGVSGTAVMVISVVAVVALAGLVIVNKKNRR